MLEAATPRSEEITENVDAAISLAISQDEFFKTFKGCVNHLNQHVQLAIMHHHSDDLDKLKRSLTSMGRITSKLYKKSSFLLGQITYEFSTSKSDQMKISQRIFDSIKLKRKKELRVTKKLKVESLTLVKYCDLYHGSIARLVHLISQKIEDGFRKEKIEALLAELLIAIDEADNWCNAVIIDLQKAKRMTWTHSVIKNNTDQVRSLLHSGRYMEAAKLSLKLNKYSQAIRIIKKRDDILREGRQKELSSSDINFSPNKIYRLLCEIAEAMHDYQRQAFYGLCANFLTPSSNSLVGVGPDVDNAVQTLEKAGFSVRQAKKTVYNLLSKNPLFYTPFRQKILTYLISTGAEFASSEYDVKLKFFWIPTHF